jgi:hypothetical protein
MEKRIEGPLAESFADEVVLLSASNWILIATISEPSALIIFLELWSLEDVM